MLDVKIKDWTQKDRQSNKTIAFGLWNGRISVQVYDSANMRNKMFRRNFSEEELILVERIIAKVIAGSPDTKCSCVFQKYDPQSKQFRVESVFALEKDSKMCYRMTVTDATKQQSHSFLLKAPATMGMGNETLKDDNLSSLKIDALKDWITNAKIWAPATVQPMDPNRFGNRSGGNGGNHGGASTSTQQSQPASASDGGGDSMLPF